MKITLQNKEAMKEFKKVVKEFKPTNITLFYTFQKDEQGSYRDGLLRVQLSKHYFDQYIHHNINFLFEVEHAYYINRIVVSEQNEKSILLNMLLENEYFLNGYFKNLDNISIGQNNGYWIDTIEIENDKRNKVLKHDQISFNNVQMIYKDVI